MSLKVPSSIEKSSSNQLKNVSSTAATGRKRRILKPLAPLTFLLRNASKTIPLALVLVMAVMLIGGIIALIDSIPLSIRTIYAYSSLSLGLSPRGDADETPKLVQIVQKESPVPIDRIMICRASPSQVQSIVGKWPFIVLGLSQPDMKYYLRREGVTSIIGHLPSPGAPEILVSRPVATNLGLKIGDEVLGRDKDNSYSPKSVKVSAIAETKQWIMTDTIEYQRAWHFPPIDLAMVFAKNSEDQYKLDAWARTRFKGEQAQVYTYADVEKQTQEMFKTLFTLLDLVIGMLVLVITLMMGMLINIYQAQRLVEFGLLQAIGFTKSRLISRALMENVIVVTLGWCLGVLAAYALLCGLQATLMSPRAFAIDVMDLKALKYTIPVPITVLLTACGTVFWRFRKFDPVAVVERRLV